jgi:CheY-like chemotaxis protein
VLIVDDDQDISKIVAEVLSDEGFLISELCDSQPAVIHAERLEPDVVLLDGGDGRGYGDSWVYAAWMRERSRPIPVIMFTAHTRELAEARLGVSERSKSAAFVGFLPQAVRPTNLRRNCGPRCRGARCGSRSSPSVRGGSDRPTAGGLTPAAASLATPVA